jgi:uncharacterized protein (DUF4415 family)
MTRQWPSFITRDLDTTSEAGSAEMMRRWLVYRDGMRALVETGGFHQDGDGWWVETATGELVGPDPEIERPLTDDELRRMRPFAEVLRHTRGPQKAPTKVSTTIRLSPEVIDHFRATGKGWQSRIDDALREYIASH